MIFEKVSELMKTFPKGKRLLGLDIGKKNIGIAISDPGLKIASPNSNLKRTKLKKDIESLEQIVLDKNIGGLICGLPIKLDGSEGKACQSIRQFVKDVNAELSIGISFWDERLSTVAVERVLIQEANLSRQRRAQIVDKVAAVYILQSALDYLSSN